MNLQARGARHETGVDLVAPEPLREIQVVRE
jgi:hypothetical protein